MSTIKRFIKRNSHNGLTKALAGFGRSLHRFYENRNHDIQSNGEVMVLKKLASFNPSVIIDGGANIGDYALMVHHYNKNSLVYAFEPVEATFEILSKKTDEVQNIIPLNKGLYKEACTKSINLFDSNTHSSIYDIKGLSYKSENQTSISLLKGDDFLKEHNIEHVDFLKIDVEGAEYDALIGFEESIKNGQIRAIQFEYGYINITTKKLLIDFHDFFEEHGYILGKIFPKKVEFRTYNFKHEDFIGPNFIAVRKSDTELIKALS